MRASVMELQNLMNAVSVVEMASIQGSVTAKGILLIVMMSVEEVLKLMGVVYAVEMILLAPDVWMSQL